MSTMSRLSWSAIPALEREEYSLELPPGIIGRLEVWKVPICEAYPDGYYESVCTLEYGNTVEPGCLVHERVKLITVKLEYGSTTDESMPTTTPNHQILYAHPYLVVDLNMLNPKE